MKKLILYTSLFFFIIAKLKAQTPHLPDSLFSGKQGNFHIQGIAVDKSNGFVYFSFTDRLIKTDFSGKLIGSVTGIVGHLGDLAMSDEGKIYASLEYKNDAIGKGIKKELGIKGNTPDGFYIAIFDVKKITRADMQADQEDLLTTVFIREAVKDYAAKIKAKDKEKLHRFGCSGIDGITFAPAIGALKDSKKFLYIAYGIYSDLERNDNDHQVILKYDVSQWKKYEQQLYQNSLHQSGPKEPKDKYFVKTGNTRYGIQNLEYDAQNGVLLAAVYKGSKPHFPNYDLFAIDLKKQAGTTEILSGRKDIKVNTLSLSNQGLYDPSSGINGWNFKWGSTGLVALGDGLFYISHNEKAQDGKQASTLYKYRWTGEARQPFNLVK